MQDRRKFLKQAATATMTASLASGGAIASAAGAIGKESMRRQENFVYRVLGRTGIRLPVISMGTGATNNAGLIRQALDSGIMLLGTSEMYYNGNNEKVIGEVVRDRPRDSFLIMTSVLDVSKADEAAGIYMANVDTQDHLRRVDDCLKRLQLDHIDILILPYAARRESVFFEPLLKAMETVKTQGKARFIGIATHSYQHEAVRAAADVGIYDVAMAGYNFRLADPATLNDSIRYAAEKGLGIIAMKTMAGVYWDKERRRPINATAALKWVLQNENVHTTVPDCSTYDQLAADLAIMGNMDMTGEERSSLEPPPDDLSLGLYCQQCGHCLAQCPASVNIPALMRSYMYAYGYGNLNHARRTLDTSGGSAAACIDCAKCSVQCRMGFDVRTRINDIARLHDVPEDFIRTA